MCKELKFRCKGKKQTKYLNKNLKHKLFHITETHKKAHQCRVFDIGIRNMLPIQATYLLPTVLQKLLS